jgi:hypothetical protein
MKPAGFALVTGASRGIGNHFARAIGARSRNLVLVARSKDELTQLASELSDAFGIRVEVIAMDLTKDGAAAELKRVVSEHGFDVDLLVNNAGFGDKAEFVKAPLRNPSSMIRLNALALVEITHYFLPPMIARRQGGIINVSSTAGFQPMPYVAVYAATKAFVTSFSMALAEEVRPHGRLKPVPKPPKTQNPAFPGALSRRQTSSKKP